MLANEDYIDPREKDHFSDLMSLWHTPTVFLIYNYFTACITGIFANTLRILLVKLLYTENPLPS